MSIHIDHWFAHDVRKYGAPVRIYLRTKKYYYFIGWMQFGRVKRMVEE